MNNIYIDKTYSHFYNELAKWAKINQRRSYSGISSGSLRGRIGGVKIMTLRFTGAGRII